MLFFISIWVFTVGLPINHFPEVLSLLPCISPPLHLTPRGRRSASSHPQTVAGLNPLRFLDGDLDCCGMYFLNVANCALAPLNFLTTVSTDVPKSSKGKTVASRRKKIFLPDVCQVQPQMPLCDHHYCHRATDNSSLLFSGPESYICVQQPL